MSRLGVAIPAAGMGRRMGGRRKPWLELAGEPLLLHSLRVLLARADVAAVRVALASDEMDAAPSWLTDADPRVRVVAGGATRAHSVREAVRALPEVELILVHDAARPLVTPEVVERCVAALPEGASDPDGAVAGWPATDTLKEVDGARRVVATPDRRSLWHAQTPQLFRARAFRDACERLEEAGEVTDDASLVEALGGRVVMVEGDPRNLKVTRPEDVAIAALFLGMRHGAAGPAGAPGAPPGRGSEP